MTVNKQQQAFDLAKDMLVSSNSSQFDDTKKYLISVLESTNWSLSLWQKVWEFLKSLFSTTAWFDKDKFNKYQKIEEKIAYLVSLGFSTVTSPLNNNDKIIINRNIWNIIEHIKNNLSQDEEIKESDAVKLTALNNLKVNLSRDEENKLNGISKKIKKLLKDNDLENAFWEMSELPAQRIQKLKTVIILLEQKWLINSDTQQAVSDFKNNFEVKLKELNEFNEEYYKLDNARTIFYWVDAKYWKIEIIDTKKQAKLEDVMKELWVDNIDSYLDTLYGQLWVTDVSQSKHKILENEFAKLKRKSNFRKTLREKKIKQPDFEKNYLNYFSFQLIEKARENFYTKKEAVFGDNVEKYDGEINNWRKVKRDKIISLQTAWDTVSLQKIFNKDSKVFFEIDWDTTWNTSIDAALRNIIDTQYWSLWIKERDSIFDHIKNRNNSNSLLYYGKKQETDDEKLKRQERTLSCLSFAWKTGSFINKKMIFPSLKGIVQASEWTVKTVIWKWVFGVITKTSVWVENILKKTNAKITKKPKTWWGKLLKSPILLALPVTKLLELWWTASNWTWWKAVDLAKQANDWINNKVKTWSNNEVDSWLQWIVAWWISKGVLWWGAWGLYDKQILNKFDEKMSREDKKKAISDFYKHLSTWKSTAEVSKILGWLDVAQKISDSTPYIFDQVEEWLSVVDELKEEKDELSKKTLKDMLEQITKIKKKIILEKTSSNKDIEKIMTQLEMYFWNIEESINWEWKFKDKLDTIKWTINKIVSYLWDWWIAWVLPNPTATTPILWNIASWNWSIAEIKKKKYNAELKKDSYSKKIEKIDNDITWIAPAPAWSSNIELINSLEKSKDKYSDNISKLEEEINETETAISKLSSLVVVWNNFSDILKLISDDSVSGSDSIIKKLNDEYAKDNNTWYSKANYETQHKDLIKKLSEIDIS